MLRLPSCITSLCTLVVSLAICAEVAHTWNAKGSRRVPVSICPDGCALSVPPGPVIVCIGAVIHDTHRKTLDHIPGFQEAAVWVFHEEGDVEMFSEV